VKPAIRKEAGIVLFITLGLMIVAGVGALAFSHLIQTQITQLKLQLRSTRAFYAAEAGLEKAMNLLKNDLYFTPEGMEPSWADSKVYTATGYIDLSRGGYITVPRYLDLDAPDYDNDFYPLIIEADYNFDGYGAYKSTYRVDISNLQGWSNRVWVKATGRYYRQDEGGYGLTLEVERRMLALVEGREISVWKNVLFAGEGQDGGVINGNADIRGSVHILGTSLGSNDVAMEFGGGGCVGNNYLGMPSDLASRVPSIAKTYGGETVDSLEGVVRIQHGKLSLSGAAHVGDPHVPGNGMKETMDGVYITDGYAGDGEQTVYSDNGTNNPYDLDEFGPGFPRLSEPYEGYSTYLDYLRANALVISDPQQLNQMRDIDPASVFDYVNSNGRVRMDGNGHLTVEGIVVIEGEINFGKKGYQHVIEYTGAGTLVSATSVGINCGLITNGLSTFPRAEILGVMAADTMTFDEAQVKVMGVFYAENRIVCRKQTSIAGALCSSYFDMGLNVPSIYQVPDVAGYLPPGMVQGQTRLWALKKLTWGEI